MPDDVLICNLEESEWQDYQQIRLEMLRLVPWAYCSTYEENAALCEEEWRLRLKRSESADNYHLLFAKVDGKVVGMAGVVPGDELDEMSIVSVYVQEKHRAKRIGQALLVMAIEYVYEHTRFRRISLTVNEKQGSALALYKKMGFIETDRIVGIMGDGNLHTEILMHLHLTEMKLPS